MLQVGSIESLVEDFSGGSMEESMTGNEAESWIMLDLGEGRGLIPTAYTIQHGFGTPANALRSWELQGSDDKKLWAILRLHANDPTVRM